MKMVAISLLMVLGLAGCVITPEFSPRTQRGADCKHECAMGMGHCHAAPYTCDRFHAKCVESCIDIEQVSSKY